MGLKGLTLNTPPEEEAHILAEDDAAIYQSIFGEDGVFAIGDRMKATVINNNQVRVSNGVICVGGHIARTVYGDYSDMTIENGEISKNRNDIITAVFSTTGEKGIDKFKIEVKKGTPGVVAEDPELTKENLYEGGKLRELPLWRVKLEGINIIGVEQMFKIIPKIPDLEEMIESLNGKLTYSSDEKQIGYTDKGEPVFRKIIYLDMTYFNKPSSGYSNLKFGAKVSFDDVFSIDSVIKQNSTGIEYQLPYSSNGSFSTWLNKISHDGSESIFEFFNNTEWGNDYTMAINIVYTKK